MSDRFDPSRWTPFTDEPDTGSSDQVRVYCFPHAGGAASSYASWVKTDGLPGVRFVPVEIPGRGRRMAEPPLTDMDELVSRLLDALSLRLAHGPFVLFGHSMGGHIAYETTRRLRDSGGPLPLGLVVSGARPPGVPDDDNLHLAGDAELAAALVRLGGTPAQVLANDELLALMLPIVRADLVLLAGHQQRGSGTPVPCPILALAGTDDLRGDVKYVERWRDLTTTQFRLRLFPGDHFFVHQHSSAVLDEIAAIAGVTREPTT